MPGQTITALLESIVNSSDSIGGLEFGKAPSKLPAFLANAEDGDHLVRMAEAYEARLFTTEDGSLLAHDVVGVSSLQGDRRAKVNKILTAANTLNNLCDLDDFRERIETLAQKQEEGNINMESLQSAYEKNEKEIANSTRAAAKPPSVKTMGRKSDVESEIQSERAEIAALETDLRIKQREINTLQRQIEGQQEMLQQIEDDSAPLNEDMDVDEQEEAIEELRKRLKQRREELKDYDLTIQGLDDEAEAENFQPAPEAEVPKQAIDYFVALTEAWQELLKSDSETIADQEIADRLESQLDRCCDTLVQIVQDVGQIQAIDNHIDVISNVNNTLIDTIATQGDVTQSTPNTSNADSSFQSNSSFISNSSSIRKATSQTILSAIVLQHIRDNDGEIAFADLKARMGEAAKKMSLPEREGVDAIYVLVANNLMVIDRSSRTTIVRVV